MLATNSNDESTAVTLTRMGREESTRCRFGLFKEVPGSVREWEDVIPQHIASAVPKYSGLANTEALPFVIGEVPLEIILIAHSSPQANNSC
jgi:hypothetical protein